MAKFFSRFLLLLLITVVSLIIYLSYFGINTDKFDNLIDTLFNNAMLLSAKVDENNLVTGSTSSTLTSNFNNSEKIRKVITVASFNTTANNSFVKIYSDYKMDITMSAKLRKTIGN